MQVSRSEPQASEGHRGRPHRFRSRSAAVRIACASLAALALGCATIEHGYHAQEYAGEPLSPAKGRGAARWQAELQHDETLKGYVAEHGRPDEARAVLQPILSWFTEGRDTMDYLYAEGLLRTLD